MNDRKFIQNAALLTGTGLVLRAAVVLLFRGAGFGSLLSMIVSANTISFWP